MNRTLAALALAGSVAAFTATTAGATPNHDKPSICHPVDGRGETGLGFNLISPDEASKHIDEKTGAGKHTRKDGRTDVYADAAGHCPGYVVVTPTPTPTPTHTHTPTPEPTPTETSTPTPTPSVTVTPDPTPTATATPDPTPTVTTPTPEPSTPAATPSPTQTRAAVPVAHSTTSPPAEPSTHRAELAQTGAKETANIIALGVLLLIVGVGLVTWARILKEGAHK